MQFICLISFLERLNLNIWRKWQLSLRLGLLNEFEWNESRNLQNKIIRIHSSETIKQSYVLNTEKYTFLNLIIGLLLNSNVTNIYLVTQWRWSIWNCGSSFVRLTSYAMGRNVSKKKILIPLIEWKTFH